jgi:hypothetical protein
MASIRRVRRDFRKDVLRLVNAGEGNFEKLMQLADTHFGANECGYKAVLKAFNSGEVNNAVSYLRAEGLVETVGKQWKPVGQLQSEDVEIIQVRRKKRVRGELQAGVRMAHHHGCTEDAVLLSRALDAMGKDPTPVAIPDESVVAK